jgi:glutamate racemase
MLNARIDHLVLGCTHYPFLIPLLRELLPRDLRIIDCGEAVARQTQKILQANALLNTTDTPPSHEFYTNGDVQILHTFTGPSGKNFLVSPLDF